MKPLRLTGLHKSKLLEMCKMLFPEWKAHSLMSNETYVSDDDITSDYADSNETFKIHWFEFCMTKLWIKINSLLNHKTPEELMQMYNAFWDISNEKLHPVDYLYEEFKKLKTATPE